MGAGNVTIELEVGIAGTAEAVFDAITDLRGYGRWLDPSAAYAGTTEISDDPVVVGTTYVEPSRDGVRHGTVTELARPTRVAFHQPMTMRPRPLGVIDVHVRYTLTPDGAGVCLARHTTLSIGWPLRLARPLVVRRFRQEIARTMHALKEFVES